MLHITPEAGLTVRRLLANGDADPAAALRLHARPDEAEFTVYAESAVGDTDVVVTEETTGARVVVDLPTAEYVADKTLDADDTVESTARLRLSGPGADG